MVKFKIWRSKLIKAASWYHGGSFQENNLPPKKTFKGYVNQLTGGNFQGCFCVFSSHTIIALGCLAIANLANG